MRYYNNKINQFSKASPDIYERARLVFNICIIALAVALISIVIHLFIDYKPHLILGDLVGLSCYSLALYLFSQKNITASTMLVAYGAIASLFIHTVVGDYLSAEILYPAKVYHTLTMQVLVLLFVGILATHKKQIITISFISAFAVVLHLLVLILKGVPIDTNFIAIATTISVEMTLAALGIYFFYNFGNKTTLALKAQKAIVNKQNQAITEQNIHLEHKINNRTKALNDSHEKLKMFSYAVSHDVREPLRMISSFLGLIQRELKRPNLDRETIDEFAHFAIDGSQRLDAMINDLLIYNRLDNNLEEVESVNLNDIIDIVQLNLQILIQDKKATINHCELPNIMANDSRMSLLFQNIISNAVKYSRRDELPFVNVCSKIKKDKIVFSIEDNGRGIDSNIINEIFRPFKRGNNSDDDKGTGIGLAICKKIVDNLNGTLEVESVIDKGSIFRIILPLDIVCVENKAVEFVV
jgi:signal transduction histidine kinase